MGERPTIPLRQELVPQFTELYYNSELTKIEIAKFYGVSVWIINQWARRFGFNKHRHYEVGKRKFCGSYSNLPWWVSEVVVELIRHELQETTT